MTSLYRPPHSQSRPQPTTPARRDTSIRRTHLLNHAPLASTTTRPASWHHSRPLRRSACVSARTTTEVYTSTMTRLCRQPCDRSHPFFDQFLMCTIPLHHHLLTIPFHHIHLARHLSLFAQKNHPYPSLSAIYLMQRSYTCGLTATPCVPFCIARCFLLLLTATHLLQRRWPHGRPLFWPFWRSAGALLCFWVSWMAKTPAFL